MTDFSRNQISSHRLAGTQIDRWVMPNDRQLCLRAKLGTGWSVRTNRPKSPAYQDKQSSTLSPDELRHIRQVVARASSLECKEKQRIGTLVNHYQRLTERCHGDGMVSCYLCDMQFYRFRSQTKMCCDCRHAVCLQCYVDTTSSTKEKITLCKICSERRELWKKSGAWFFGEIPPHAEVQETTAILHESTRPLTPQGSPALGRRRLGSTRSSAKDQLDNTSTGFGQEIQIHIMKCKDGGADSDDDSSDGSTLSYKGSCPRFTRTADWDTLSASSRHLKHNPLLTPRGSDESLNTLANDEQEFSATESLQDLRLLSLQPATSSLDGFSLTKSTGKQRQGVKFHPDTVSQKSDHVSSPKTAFADGIPRCISIPNADLKDVDYHEEEDKDSPFGSLIFTLFYQESEETLEIEMLGAQHLPDTVSVCNTYVSINLVPSLGNSRKHRTLTEQNTLDPKWKQKISYFGVSIDELLYKSLVFSVIDERLIGTDHPIAEFRMALRQVKSYELTHYHVYMEKQASAATDEAVIGDEKGKVLLTARYETKTAQLYIGVVRCAALTIPNREGYADPYVKLYLLPDYSKTSKRKTAAKRRTLNPEFHEEFVYKVALDALATRTLEITVWDRNMTRNALLGGVCLSMSSTLLSEKNHWSTIISQPDRRHDSWHMLRDISSK